MKQSGGEIIVKALNQVGIKYIFGIPGTHNIELYDVLIDSPLFPVLITDEQSAAFMADGVARSSGKLGAINVVPGAGLTHALSGIAEAYLDQVPLLVLASGIRRDTPHAYQLHDIDQMAIIRPVTKSFFQPETHSELYTAILGACQCALTPPFGPVAVEVPANLYLFREEVADSVFSTTLSSATPPVPSKEQLSRTIECLNRSKEIVLYVGQGTRHAREELEMLSDRLDALVFTTISAKGVFDETHPRWAWNTMGKAAPEPLRRLGDRADCVLAMGCRFGEVATGSYGFSLRGLIHVDIDETVFDRNYKAQLNIRSDSRTFMRILLADHRLSKRVTNDPRLTTLAKAHQPIEPERNTVARVSPSLLLRELQRQCGESTIYVTDSGNGTFLAMEHLRLRSPGQFLAPVDYSCMGYAVPAAIGAKFANPGSPVVALAGDGAFLMTGLELTTAVSYHIPLMVFLLRDRELSQIAQFQRMSLNREVCTELHDYDAQAITKGVGAQYLAMKTNENVVSVVAQALAIYNGGRVVLIEVEIDYSQSTRFSKGVMATNFFRLPWKDRIRLISRLIARKLASAHK